MGPFITVGWVHYSSVVAGGLGNQMFQYAAAKHLSIINNSQLKIDASDFSKCTSNKDHTLQLCCFNISAQQAEKAEITALRPSKGMCNRIIRRVQKLIGLTVTEEANNRIYVEPAGSCFKPIFFELGSDMYLFGYFLLYKYFEPIRTVLIHEFRPKEEISSAARNLIGQIEVTNSVNIHIRRGDYFTDPNVRKCIEGIITDDYYNNPPGASTR